MIETDKTDAGTLAQRLHIAASPDWQNLLTYFDLSGEGFAFIVLIVPDKDWADACRYALERYLLSFRRKLVVVPFDSAEEFGDKLAERLLSLKPDEETGAVWVSAAVPEAVKEYESWAEAWSTGVARLNQYRNPLREQFQVPLLFVGSSWVQPVIREMAPDLWSVRTLVVRIETTISQTTESSSFPSQSLALDWDEGRAIDSDFALQQAEKLREQPGKELALANLLHRAAQSLFVRYRLDEAEHVLKETIDLRRRFGAELADLGASLFDLAKVHLWKAQYEAAEADLLEALRFFQQGGDVISEANCLDVLGDIAFRSSRLDEAQARYEQALLLSKQVDDKVGGANCLQGLGDIAFVTSQLDDAKARYEEALLLSRNAGYVLGEANCLARLGEIALATSQLDEAQVRYEQALSLSREAEDIRGEANSFLGMGKILVVRGELKSAKDLFYSALKLFQQIHDARSIGLIQVQLALLATNEIEQH